MIVGISPGNREIELNKAFSGQSGKRLNDWLLSSGASAADPRKGIYFTSVLKCKEPTGMFDHMARRCRHFLRKQLAIIRPELVITLGKQPYHELQLAEVPFSEAIGELQVSDHLLVTQLGYNYALLAWPHPSGLNRQLNDAIVQAKLQSSFNIVRPYICTS